MRGDGKRCAQHFVKVDGRAVGGDHFARVGANQSRDFVAQVLWLVNPAGSVPGADQASAPFLRDHLRNPCCRRFGQRAE